MARNTLALRGFCQLLNVPKRTMSGGSGAQRPPARRSCAGEEAPPCAECAPTPPPACRAAGRAAASGVRVACRPPPHPHRPPCAAPPPPCAITCDQLHTQNATTHSRRKEGCQYSTKRCGDSLDRVAQRIVAAKLARRLDYEREVALRKDEAARAPPPPVVKYLLGTEREVARATDGRDYVVLSSATNSTNKSKYPQTVQLDPAKDCTIKRSTHVDPCAHQPRTLLEIDRSEAKKPPSSDEKSKKDKKNEAKVATISKNQCKKNSLQKLNDWCSTPPELTPNPSPCRQPNLVDRLKVRSKSSCNLKRDIHTIPPYYQTPNKQCEKTSSDSEMYAIISKINADKEKFDKMMSERNELKESGRGRTGFLDHNEKITTNGVLELQIPTGTNSVRVNVGLYAAQPSSATTTSRSTTSTGENVHHAFSKKNDSWLSIKNIQKKFSGCRKETTPIKNVDKKECTTRHPTSSKSNQHVPRTICQPRATSPCAPKQNSSAKPCLLEQKPKQSPCDTKPTRNAKKFSSTFDNGSNTIIST